MPTCPRCALLALALGVLAFAGCDTNNPGSSLSEIQGVYEITELRFDPSFDQPNGADIINVRDDLTRAEVRIAEDGVGVLEFFRTANQILSLSVNANSRTVTLTARTNVDAAKLERILLPPVITLNRDEDRPNRLSATLDDVTGVDLEAYDPDLDGLNDVRGQIFITLERTL